jgi:hypothetical protein
MHEDNARMAADIPVRKAAAPFARLVQSLHKTKNIVALCPRSLNLSVHDWLVTRRTPLPLRKYVFHSEYKTEKRDGIDDILIKTNYCSATKDKTMRTLLSITSCYQACLTWT